MKSRTMFLRSKHVFCRFEDKCEFKKRISMKNTVEPKSRYICLWKGYCNQQIDHPKCAQSQRTSELSTQLYVRSKTKEITNKILKVAVELRLSPRRKPTSMAAAANYIASLLTGERKTQQEIAQIAHLTEVTVRKRCEELAEHLFFSVFL